MALNIQQMTHHLSRLHISIYVSMYFEYLHSIRFCCFGYSTKTKQMFHPRANMFQNACTCSTYCNNCLQ